MSGRASYYTDWLADDPVLGRNRWETFLTRELPPLLDARFAATGRNAVAGLSMSATSALNLAIHAPGLYQAVGACTGPLAAALAGAGVPATVHFHPGTHAWAYWQDDLHRSWPVFAGALGV